MGEFRQISLLETLNETETHYPPNKRLSHPTESLYLGLKYSESFSSISWSLSRSHSYSQSNSSPNKLKSINESPARLRAQRQIQRTINPSNTSLLSLSQRQVFQFCLFSFVYLLFGVLFYHYTEQWTILQSIYYIILSG